MGAGDRLLIGTDLVKDRAMLEAAYNDSEGVTAEFNRNVLRVINSQLGADFDPEAFEHGAFFDEANSWIEMRLRANGAQTVRIDGADLEVRFEDGEEMRTEISAKFTRAAVEAELAARACASTRSTPTTGTCSASRRRRVAVAHRFPAMDLNGAGAFIAGGASGLGEATARALVERGARVAIADVNDEKAEALASELGPTPSRCTPT